MICGEKLICFLSSLISGVRRGLGGFNPPPPTGKNCCRKMMLFPKFLFLATNFLNIDKNSIILLNFHQKFSKFSQNFPTICGFRPNARKINACFVKYFENSAKIMHFRKFLEKNFSKLPSNLGVSRNVRKMNAWYA